MPPSTLFQLWTDGPISDIPPDTGYHSPIVELVDFEYPTETRDGPCVCCNTSCSKRLGRRPSYPPLLSTADIIAPLSDCILCLGLAAAISGKKSKRVSIQYIRAFFEVPYARAQFWSTTLAVARHRHRHAQAQAQAQQTQ